MNNDEKILTILAEMQKTQSEMQVEQRKTNERLDSMEALQTEMQTDLREVKADLNKVKADLNEVKEEGQITRNIVTRMENDHGTKLGVIFDGLDLHKNMIKASKEEVMEKVTVDTFGVSYPEPKTKPFTPEYLKMEEEIAKVRKY